MLLLGAVDCSVYNNRKSLHKHLFKLSVTGTPTASFHEIAALIDFKIDSNTLFSKVIGLWDLKYVSCTELLSKFTFNTIQLEQ